MEIFVGIDLEDHHRRAIQALTGSDKLHLHGLMADDDPIPLLFAGCEVVFGNPPASWLKQSNALRWLQLESVGFGEYMDLDWGRLGSRVTMTNLAGFFADPVAESVLAGILSLYRGIDRLTQLKNRKAWVGDPLRKELRCLRGRRVVLFGRGAINQRLKEMLEAFHCVVEVFGRDWKAGPLDRALSAADIVACTVPDTPMTRGVFSRERLARLREDALFVNAGRGSLVEEDALVEMLNARRLGGAVIDVTREEPLPVDHGLWDCPNTIVTQHTGGGSDDETDRKIEVFSENLARYRRGEALSGVIDFTRGY